jgi:guanine deaminase
VATDTHIHAPQYPNSGLFGSTTLLDWLKTYTYPTEARFSSLPLARRVYSTLISTTLSHGTTTASYFATIHVPATNLLATLCHTLGQRALIGRICMDHPHALVDYYRDKSTSSALKDTHTVIAHIQELDPRGESVVPILTPRSAVSCTKELLSAFGSLSEERGLRIQTHLSENVDEIALVRKMYPECESYTAVYNEYNLVTPRTILAHCIHLSPSERKLIVEKKAKIAHCPASNSSLAFRDLSGANTA